MLERYLFIIGLDQERRASYSLSLLGGNPADAGLKLALQTDRVTALCGATSTPILLGDGWGVVVGPIFDIEAGHARKTFVEEHDAAHVIETNGLHLIEKYWGGYVSVWENKRTCRVEVLRDPLGAMPCYYVHQGALTIITSDIGLLFRNRIIRAEIAWRHVAAHLVADQLRTSQTCLAGIAELIGGHRLSIADSGISIAQVWNPWTFALECEPIEEEAEAVGLLRDMVMRTTHSWAGLFTHVLLEISGGLDSSILGACLAQSSTPFTCVTFATDDPLGDEREYARLAARMNGAELFEKMESVGRVDVARSDAAHLPRPIARAFAQSGDWSCASVAEHVGADAYFSGAGGDNIFCFLQSVAPVADRIIRRHSVGRIMQTARDVSTLVDRSIWTVLIRSVRRALGRPPAYIWPLNHAFLTQRGIALADAPFEHPWLQAPAGAVPGKAAHIAWLLGIQNHLEGFARERSRPVISPLMSQPLVELCLRIPSWLWCRVGRNRSIAREAFREHLPPPIVNRKGKGTPGPFVAQIFEQNRRKIHDLLADSLLSREGIIDRNAIERVISGSMNMTTIELSRLMSLVDVESWLRCWDSRCSDGVYHE